MHQSEIHKNVQHNFICNVLDGAFFGLGMGFASMDSVIPFFFNTLTDSTVLIGYASSMHNVGWQLPQLFTAKYVSRLRRYKPMTLLMTTQERWPFLALALVALLVTKLGTEMALILSLILVTWQGIGGGVTATAWQSMIGKIMPSNRVGTFFGFQSSAANLLVACGAIAAGFLLKHAGQDYGFGLCFLIASLAMLISLNFLAMTREPENEPAETDSQPPAFRENLRGILKKDPNFRWFLAARVLFQFAMMASYFFTIYAIRRFDMDEQTGGLMVGMMALVQTFANPIMGWIGDRWSHRRVFAAGALVMAGSVLLATVAPGLGWIYLAFGMAGFARVATWVTVMALTLEFGEETERPYYIGLSNTLIAPATLVVPLLGGWLADMVGFGATFLAAALCGLLAAFILQFVMRDPRQKSHDLPVQPAVAPI